MSDAPDERVRTKRAIVQPAEGSLAARFAFLDLLVAIGDRVYPYSEHGPREGEPKKR